MGAPKQITFIAGPDGAVTKYQPPPAAPLDLYARADAYRRAMGRLASFFEECGFSCNSIIHGATSISLQKNSVMFDVSIRRPERIAYVTSHPGYTYDPQPIGITPNIKTPAGIVRGQTLYSTGATVKCLSAEIRTEKVIQIVYNEEGLTQMPIYVELPEDLPDPETYIIVNVLGVMKMVAANSPKLTDIFEDRFVKRLDEPIP